MSTEDEEFKAAQKLVGPKRFKTEQYEVEAHDPLRIQKLTERRTTRKIRMSSFGGTIMEPKNVDCICKNEKDQEC